MIQLQGPWKDGYAFDMHVLYSTYTGVNEFGYSTFDTHRSQIGQLLYELKYGQHLPELQKICEILSQDAFFVSMINWMDVILPVPPSNKYRQIQPVLTIAQSLSIMFQKEIRTNVLQSTNKDQLKNTPTAEKYAKVKASIIIDSSLAKDKKILIFDDVYDSGSTLAAITDTLKENGYSNVYIFTLTKTRNSD